MSLLERNIAVLYQLVLQAAGEGICGLDPGGRIAFANPAAVELTGFTTQELAGQSFHQLLHHSRADGSALAEADCRICQARAEEAVHRVSDDVFWRKDGTAVPVAYVCTPIREDNHLTGFVVTFHDIAGSKQAEAELKHRAAIVEASDNAIIGISRDERIISWNQGAAELYGFKAQEIVGEPIQALIPDNLLSAFRRHFTKVLNNKSVRNREAVHRGKARKHIDVNMTLSPIPGTDGSIQEVAMLTTDISERKRVEQLKDEFVSKVSHEIRSPLTVVGTALSNLEEGVAGPLTDKQHTVMEVAAKSLKQLSHMINDLLDLSRLESHKVPLDQRSTDLKSVLVESIELFQVKAKQRVGESTVQISCLPSNVTGMAYADAQMIGQILSNLLDNALRFARSKIEISLQESGDFFEVIVGNDGSGIPKKDRHRIFNRFEQLERKADAGGYKGTGLGLSICREIVERHQGRIWIEGGEVDGVEFHFTIPLYNEEALIEAQLHRAIHSAGKKKHSVSYIRLYLVNFEELKRIHNARGVEQLLRDLYEDLTQKALRRGDMIFSSPQTGSLTIVLELDFNQSAKVLQRLQHVTQESLARHAWEEAHPQIEFYYAVYPQDGLTPKDLLRAARPIKNKNIIALQQRRTHA